MTDESRPAVHLVAGARPNFMKLAPVQRALAARGTMRVVIVHTGQHYDHGMNDVFFEELGIPAPDIHLGVGSAPHGAQTGRILERYEAALMEARPAAVLVFGDVNSTIACALAAVKLGIPVAHVEAGLRSFDRTMPEEINRILTDAIADVLFVTERSGRENLEREGIGPEKIRMVGNVMIDTLRRELERARALESWRALGYEPGGYGLVTMHRPSNVDEADTLERMLRTLGELSVRLPLVFPMHPRTRAAVDAFGLGHVLDDAPGLRVMEPVPYRENLCLMASAKVVLTDSGGMQEEASILGVPCLTMRENTERPITVERGSCRLVGNDPDRIVAAFDDVMAGRWRAPEEIPLWDGRAAERIAEEVERWVVGS